MRWEVLLEWMTHLGTGTWEGFRRAVSELLDEEYDVDAACRRLRIAMSDLGHAEFFIGESRRWRVLKPALIEVADGRGHLFVGGRSRGLTDSLLAAVESVGASVVVGESIPGLRHLFVTGDSAAICGAAAQCRVGHVPEAAAQLAARLPTIRSTLANASEVSEPINWSVRTWSFDELQWVEGRRTGSVREYSNKHGVRRYLVHLFDDGKPRQFEIERRAAVYAAAFRRGVKIVKYCRETQSLRVPRWAPLPSDFSRVACLASGHLGSIDGSAITFAGIPPEISSVLLVALGQGVDLPEES